MKCFQYSVMKYVNDIVKDEVVNIGVIVTELDSKTYVAKMIDNFEIVKMVHRDSNIMHVCDLIEGWRGEHELELSLEELSQRFRHQLQFTYPRGGLGDNIYEEVDDLYDLFISIDKIVPDKYVEAESIRKHVRSAIQANIDSLGISPAHVRKNYVVTGNARKIMTDFAFENGSLKDLISIIPVTSSDPDMAREKSALLAVDYACVKDSLDGAVLHAFIHGDNGSYASDLIREDLESAGCRVKGYDDIPACMGKIKNRLAA